MAAITVFFCAAAISLAALGASAALAQRAGAVDPEVEAAAHRLDRITTGQELFACQMKPNVEAGRALLAASNFDDAKKYAKRFKWRQCTLSKRGHDFISFVPNDPQPDPLREMAAWHFLQGNLETIAALPPLPRKRVYDRPWFAATSRHDSIDEMATCVAETNPAGAVALIRTLSKSKEERSAFSALNDTIVACLRADVRLNTNRTVIRGALVEALYQRTQPWPIGQAELAGVTK